MDRDEIIEQAKEKLRDSIERSDEPEAQYMRETLSLLETLSEPAKAEPEQDGGEFTKELRDSVVNTGGAYGYVLANLNQNKPLLHGTIKNFQDDVLEACSRLDAQAKEIASRERRIEFLTAENAKLREEGDQHDEIIEKIQETIGSLCAENKALAERNEKLETALQRIQTWAKAYPLDVFPKPDFVNAAEVLSAAGLNLDGISADNMRHVLDGLKDICEQALKPGEKE